MRIHTMLFVAGTLALSLVGCSEQITGTVSGDDERAQLSERVLALKASVITSGQMNDVQRSELEDIRNDIAQWQTRTGRKDLSFSSRSFVLNGDGLSETTLADLANTVTTPFDENAVAAAQVARMLSNPIAIVSRPAPPTPKCLPCPPVSTRPSDICFLLGGACDPDTGFRICGYACMRD